MGNRLGALVRFVGVAALLATPAFAEQPSATDAARGEGRPGLNLTLQQECAPARGIEATCASAVTLRSRFEPRGSASAAAPPANGFYVVATSSRTGAIWAPGRTGADASLQRNRVPIGDASLGVARRLGAGEVSLGVATRDVSQRVGAQSYSRRDDFAGVSFTLRR